MFFPTLTVLIRCVIEKEEIFYPQTYLGDCYYKNLISHERIDKSEGIDLDRSEKYVKWMICNHYYFKYIGFKYQPYVCNGCHDFSMTVMNLSDFFVLYIKGINYRVYTCGINKKEAVNILNNSVLDNKGVL